MEGADNPDNSNFSGMKGIEKQSVSIGQVRDKKAKLGNNNSYRKKCIDLRTIVVRDWMWRVREGTIWFLEMIRRIMVPPILRTEREVYGRKRE